MASLPYPLCHDYTADLVEDVLKKRAESPISPQPRATPWVYSIQLTTRPVRATICGTIELPLQGALFGLYPFTQGVALGYGEHWAFSPLCMSFDFTSTLPLIYLMLPLFEKEEGDCENDFERWIFVLRNMNTFERMPFMAKNAVFKKLAEISDIRSLSKKEMDKYEYSLRVMRDSYATYQYAAKNGWKKGMAEGIAQGKAEGIAQGKAEGIAQGKAEGLAQGMEKGEREKALAIARNLKSFGMSLDQIAEATGLTPRRDKYSLTH